jgi:hypothetical protein
VGGLSAFAGDLALQLAVHRRETALAGLAAAISALASAALNPICHLGTSKCVRCGTQTAMVRPRSEKKP